MCKIGFLRTKIFFFKLAEISIFNRVAKNQNIELVDLATLEGQTFF